MITEPEDPPSPEMKHCFDLVMRAITEPDDAKAMALIDASCEAFVADVQERTREKFASLDTLLEEAQRAIDAAEVAEAAGDLVERAKQMQLSKLYLSAAKQGRLAIKAGRRSL